MEEAPASVRTGPLPYWSWTLNSASLRVIQVKMAKLQFSESSFKCFLRCPFEVIAFSGIGIEIPENSQGYRGRSHSLWYCDAKNPGEFRWYETAFMISPLVSRSSDIDPFALAPDRDAHGALAPVMDKAQVAWPFTPIDQGNESDSIERWVGWFAEAALGNLQRSSHMPEFDTKGSWRY